MGKRKQNMFLIPPNSIECPPAESIELWRGKCAENFKIAMRGYKGGEYQD